MNITKKIDLELENEDTLSNSDVSESAERIVNRIGTSRLAGAVPLSLSDAMEQAVSTKGINKNSLTAGIIIKQDAIGMVLTGINKATHSIELMKWSRVVLPKLTKIENQSFPAFLRSTLEEFLTGFNKVDIWTAIDTRDLKFKSIIIPDLPDSKISNAAQWGLKNEIGLSLKDEIFDFEIIENVQIDGIKKKTILAYTAPKTKINFLKTLFIKSGFPLKGISALPFAHQNFIRKNIIDLDSYPSVIVNISRSNSDIYCLSEKGVMLVRNLRSGTFSLIEDMIDTKNDPRIDSQVITDMISDDFNAETSTFDQTSISTQRLIGKIMRTGDYYSNNVANNDPIHSYLFYGEMDDCNAFTTYAKSEITSSFNLFNPFKHLFSKTLSASPPNTAANRNSIIPAYALALSTNKITPNFLYTYVQKKVAAKYKKMNLTIVGICAFFLILGAGAWFYLNSIENTIRSEIAVIETQLSKFSPNVTNALLSEKISKADLKSKMIQSYIARFLPLGVINEICSKTPETISLISLNADFKSPKITQPGKGKSKKPIKKSGKKEETKEKPLTLKGIVADDFTALESTLTGYIIQLNDSPFFKNINLEDKTLKSVNGEHSLLFTATMEIR